MAKLIKKIKLIPKAYFSFADIRKIGGLNDQSLKKAIGRMVKSGELVKITRGIYTLDVTEINWEKLALEIYSPSYLSFEWVLGKYNILSQKALNLTLATTKRSKKLETPQNIIFYHHMQPKLFGGYARQGDLFIADPEKAFIDLAYLSLNGYAHFDFEEMNLELLDKEKIKKYLKRIQNQKLTALLAGL